MNAAASNMSDPEFVSGTGERKSELRVRLEGALYLRARRGAPDELNWGISVRNGRTGRWQGEAWFRDPAGEVVRASITGLKTPEALGLALCDAIESIEVER